MILQLHFVEKAFPQNTCWPLTGEQTPTHQGGDNSLSRKQQDKDSNLDKDPQGPPSFFF